MLTVWYFNKIKMVSTIDRPKVDMHVDRSGAMKVITVTFTVCDLFYTTRLDRDVFPVFVGAQLIYKSRGCYDQLCARRTVFLA